MSEPSYIHIELSAYDRQLIDDEHVRLEQFLHDLCDTCSEFMTLSDCDSCSKEKVASCQGRLPSFFYDFQDLLAEHFENEEKIIGDMLRSARDSSYFQLHQDAHSKLMRDVKQLIQELALLSQQGNVVAAIRQFYQIIVDRIGEHDRSFDSALGVAPLDWSVSPKP